MQSPAWYLRRLQSMSPGEVAWRVRSAVRDAFDRGQFAAGRRPRVPGPVVRAAAEAAPPLRLADVAVGEWANPPSGAPEQTWVRRLVDRAERIAGHRLTFFDLVDHHLGDPIDWNRDHKNGRPAPLGFAPAIDYRDFRVTGDAKFVWEPSRHQHLVVLARAYRASGERRFAEAVVEQLESWLEQCPFGSGMNWRSPLELAIRLINWVWALDLVHESGVVGGALRERLVASVYLHLREITRKYSKGSSANNHLIGEAAGVFVGASYFPLLDPAGRWRQESRAILAREAVAQTRPDGGNCEQALGYHVFVLQFFLAAGLVARHARQDFPPAYWSAFGNMLEFLAAMGEGGDAPPMFGDADDGYVLDVGAGPLGSRGLLAAGAALLGRSDLEPDAGRDEEPVRWLLGRDGCASLARLAPPPPVTLSSRAFPDTGVYLLQSGGRGAADRVSVAFDCGELGFGSIAAHGHADALSFTLRAFGVDVLVDPGTYDYFTYPEWREYFRSTRAHNTVMVDGVDQSVMQGPFLWGARAVARCVSWRPEPDVTTVTGEHDGYRRLDDPVVHRRTLTWDRRSRTLTVDDEIAATGAHDLAVLFHASEAATVALEPGNRAVIDVGRGIVTLVLDPSLTVEALRGSEAPIGGWVSRGYHRRAPATTIVGRTRSRGSTRLRSVLHVGAPTVR